MGKLESWNADGRDDLFRLAPEKLTVVVDKQHPLFDERVNLPLDEALVRNIMCNGVIEPVVVRQNGKSEDGTPVVEVVDGRQRVRCAIEANKRLTAEGKEPVQVSIVRRRGEVGDLFGVMISANELRRDDGIMVKARKLSRYMVMGRSEEDAATQFGCSVPTVRNLLSLLELHSDVQKAIERDALPATVAKELHSVPQEEQPAALEKLIASGNVRGARGLEAAKNVRRNGHATASKKRMMSRVQLVDWQKKLGELKGHQAEIAYSVVDFILGKAKAFVRFPQLRASTEEK